MEPYIVNICQLIVNGLGRRSGRLCIAQDLWMAEAAEADMIDEADGARLISWDELHRKFHLD